MKLISCFLSQILDQNDNNKINFILSVKTDFLYSVMQLFLSFEVIQV